VLCYVVVLLRWVRGLSGRGLARLGVGGLFWLRVWLLKCGEYQLVVIGSLKSNDNRNINSVLKRSGEVLAAWTLKEFYAQYLFKKPIPIHRCF